MTPVPWYSISRTVASRPTSSSPGGAQPRRGRSAAPRALRADQLARHDVVAAHEAGDELGGAARRRPRAAWPACSIRPSFITTIRSASAMRLVLAVGDVDEGDAELALQPLQLARAS